MKRILIFVFLLLAGILVYFVVSNYTGSKSSNNDSRDSNQTTLDLSGKGLSKVPDYVFDLKKLVSLDISDNNISGAVRGEIRFLSKLKTLDLSNNKMTGLPAEIGQLSNLETLNVSKNNLTGLPNELGNLKKLKVLNISGNNYSQQDLENILKKLPSTVQVIK